MTISRRAFLRLLGLAPAAALLPKVTLPEAPAIDPAAVRTLENGAASLRRMEGEAEAHGLRFFMSQEMADDIAPDFSAFRDAGYFHRLQPILASGSLTRPVISTGHITQWNNSTWSQFARNWQPGDTVTVRVLEGKPTNIAFEQTYTIE